LPESERVIDDWGEEVDRLHQHGAALEREDRRIVGGGDADENPRIVDFREPAQDLRQIFRVELARSPGAVAVGREPYRRHARHLSSRRRTPGAGAASEPS
jgi:hypothetical protein